MSFFLKKMQITMAMQICTAFSWGTPNFLGRGCLKNLNGTLNQSLRVYNVFLSVKNLLPTPLFSLFHFNFEYHNHFTHSRFNLHKVFAKYHLSMCSQAPSSWNSLPITFRNSLNISKLRRNIKKHFLIN